jgi:hypothetical protein
MQFRGEQMKVFDLCAKFSLAVIVFTTAFVFQPGIATAQSRDESHPTPVSEFPITGRLGAGSYYYSVPATAGRVNMTLDFTPPDGGGGMSVSMNGPNCCTSEAYAGADTGLSNPVRRQASFDVPSAQTLLVKAYIAVGGNQTVQFTLNFSGSIGGPAPPSSRGSGVIITAPAMPPPRPCTDLALVDGFRQTGPPTSVQISGVIRNLSPTAYVGRRRLQWLEVLDMGVAGAPRMVKRIGFTDVPARGTLAYSANDPSTSTVGRRYEVRIVYSPYNSTDRLDTNDDCDSSNNISRGRPTIFRAEDL